MSRRTAAACVAVLVVGCATAVLAHHSIGMVEISTPMWVKGKVVVFRAQHPHAMVKLDVRGADGNLHQWEIEGPNLARLERMGADKNFLKAGDVVEVCGFPLKQPWAKAGFIHGQVLVMPDGRMRLFGPYGKLANCVRPADTVQKWVRFLREDALAMPAWCNGKLYVMAATVGPPALVESIDQQLENPCD
jgi:hypothetical protein